MSVPVSDNESSPDSDAGKYALLDQLAAEYAERYRKRERPDLQEYIDRHPDLADEIRDLFPAMVEIERAERGSQSDRRPDLAGAAPVPSQVGDYRVLREVGRGGMGIVYEAEQLSLGRHVALKVMLGTWARAGSLERFRREARAAARLHHTNIVPVFDVGQDRDVAYYAMQFIQGQGLDLVIRELRRLRDRSRGAEAFLFAPSGADPDRSAGSHSGPPSALGELALAENRLTSGDRISRVTYALLTGRMTLELSRSPQTEAASGLAAAGDDAPAIKRPRIPVAPSSMSGSHPAGAVAVSNTSAVLPGGTPISSSDAPGRRSALYRSVAQIGRQVAEALAYAHARGVVHHDIKPSNLLLDTAGVVWITDFGLAKGDDEGLTHTGDVIGTVRYMAPERFRGEGDARADIYALGLTLYELLVLEPAFHSSDRLRLIDKIQSQEPARLRSIDARIPRDLETIVLKAIEKEPRRRYASAAAMADDLRRFHDGEPIQARAVTQVERAVKWMRRRPYLAISLASIGALAFLLLIVQIRSNIQIERALSEAKLQQWNAENSERAARAAGATAEKEGARAAAAALEARREAARSTMREAQAAAESGAIERGLFKLVDALELAPDQTADDHATRAALRRSLASWRATHPVLRHLFNDVDEALFLGDDGLTLALLRDRRLSFVDLVSGRAIDDPDPSPFPALIHAASPDLSLVVAGKPETGLTFYDRVTRRPRATLPPSRLWVPQDRTTEFGPANRFFIFPTQEENRVIIRFRRLDATASTVGPSRVVPIAGRALEFHCCLLPARGGHTVLAELPIEPSAGGGSSTQVRFFDLDLDKAVEGICLEPGDEGRGWPFDGSSLVTTSPEGLIRWWDPATGRPARPAWWPERAAFAATLFDCGRALAVCCDDRRIRWFDLIRREQCGPSLWIPTGSIQQVTIAPGGMFFLAMREKTLGVWQCPGPLEPSPSNEGEAARVRYDLIDFSPDRSAFLLGQPPPDGVRLNWPNPISSRANLRERTGVAGSQSVLPPEAPVGPPLYPWTRYPIFSPDGRYIAAARSEWERDGVAQSTLVGVWEARTGRPVMPLRRVRDSIHSIAFSPDGKTLAVGIVPGIEIFDVATGRHRTSLFQPGPISRLAFRPDGRILAAGTRVGWGSPVGVRLWDLATNQPAGPLLACEVLPFVRFDPDGKSLLVFDTETRRLSRLGGATGIPLAPALILNEPEKTEAPSQDDQGETSTAWGRSYLSVAVDIRADGRVLAEATRSAVVRQWDLDLGRPVGPPLIHPVPIMVLSYSPDGSILACGAVDGAVRLWYTATGQVMGPTLPHGGLLLSLAFNPDGKTLVVVKRDGRRLTWTVPALPSIDRPERLREWVEAWVGFRSRADGTFAGFSAAGWDARRERLAAEKWADLAPCASREMLIAWHRDRAAELVRLGRPLPARRHLDALSKLCPDDWTTAARRAVALAELGRLDAAELEYARAAQRAPAAALSDWYWRQAVSSLDGDTGISQTEPGKLELALWYLDKVLAARPDDWRAWFERSDILGRLGRDDLREADEDRALERGAGPFMAFDFTALAAAHGRLSRAVQLISGSFEALDHECEGLPGVLDGWRATLLVHLGEHVLHHRLCRRLLDDHSNQKMTLNLSAAEACAVGPIPHDLAEVAVLRLETTLNHAPDSLKHLVLGRKGAALYRAGHPAEAIRALEEGIRKRGEEWAEDLAFLAMAHQALGHDAAAHECLGRLEAHCKRSPLSGDFWTRISRDDLLEEARAKMVFDPVFPTKPFADR
jgi:serine/threonine protein kinase/WD40 repeat protein/Flp pilus assembly protein TadD